MTSLAVLVVVVVVALGATVVSNDSTTSPGTAAAAVSEDIVLVGFVPEEWSSQYVYFLLWIAMCVGGNFDLLVGTFSDGSKK